MSAKGTPMMSGRFDHLPPTQEMLRQRGASAGERALHERLGAIVQRRLAQAQDLDRQMAERATMSRETRRREIEARVAVALQQREARDAVRSGAEQGTPGQTKANERKASGGGAPKG